MARKYEKVQELLPIIKARLAEGKTQREIAEEFGLKDKYVVQQLLTRERRKERKAEAYEIQRLKMENELLRDFLSLIRKE